MTSLGDRRARDLIFVYIMEEVAHAHAQNAPLDWFLTTPVQDLLVAYLSIDIHGEAYTPNSVLKTNILVIYTLLLREL